MLPGLCFALFDLASIWTGWTFTVSSENIYTHGPLFWLQAAGAYGMILISFAHIILYLLLCEKDRISRHDIQKLLTFYVVKSGQRMDDWQSSCSRRARRDTSTSS